MTEKGIAFFTEVNKNEELKARLLQIDRSDMKAAITQAIELAKSFGFELTAADLEQVSAEDGKLVDDELDSVAGGICGGVLYVENENNRNRDPHFCENGVYCGWDESDMVIA